MSRSRKYQPFGGNCVADSEKDDKRRAHRAYRRRLRQMHRLDDAVPQRREMSNGNVWLWAKDGKSWFDPERWPEMMRK